MKRTVLFALVAIMALFYSSNAFAASTAGPREGSGGNNVVCGGVPTKAILMYYAHGGVDSCGHRDISAVWAKMGITPQVAQGMHAGTVCSSGGFTSSGRNHSPNSSADQPIVVNGHTVYFRPLSVWGSACYSAWVGHTEDGRTVAVLIGCGNGETTHVPPKAPTQHAAKPGTSGCNITITNSPGAVAACGNVSANKCSQVGGNHNTINCGAASKPKVAMVPVSVAKTTPNWKDPAQFRVNLTVNGGSWKAVNIPNDGNCHQVGTVARGSTVVANEPRVDRWESTASSVNQTLKANAAICFHLTNYRLAGVWVTKQTVVNGSDTSNGSQSFGFCGSWSSTSNLAVPNDNKAHFMAWLIEGKSYTVTECDTKGYTPDSQGFNFTLMDSGVNLLFVNRRSSSSPSPPTTTPPPTTTTTPPTVVPKTPPPPTGGGGPGPPSAGNPQPPGVPDTTSSASGPVNPDGSQYGGGEAPDPA